MNGIIDNTSSLASRLAVDIDQQQRDEFAQQKQLSMSMLSRQMDLSMLKSMLLLKLSKQSVRAMELRHSTHVALRSFFQISLREN